MSAFAEHERLVSEAIDAYHGERTRIEAMKSGRYFAGSADPTKAAIEAVGVVDVNPVLVMTQDKGKYDGMRPMVQADKVHVSYDERVFGSWQPTAGCLITLLARGEKKLRVSRADPDGLGRVVCVCNWEGASDEPSGANAGDRRL